MPWYVEYKTKPSGLGRPKKKLLKIDCPDNIKARNKALQQAKKTLQSKKLRSPLLVWKESIS